MAEILIFFALPALAAVICYLIENIRLQYSISLSIALLHLGMSFSIFLGLYNPNLPYFFSTDSLSKLFLIVLSNVYFWVVLVSYSFLKRDVAIKGKRSKKYYFGMLNFYLLANTTAL